jgi:hypothetical protein
MHGTHAKNMPLSARRGLVDAIGAHLAGSSKPGSAIALHQLHSVPAYPVIFADQQHRCPTFGEKVVFEP